jgi:hypothetical protein
MTNNPKTKLKTITLDKATIDDLIGIVDRHINFINDNVHRNRAYLEPQRERLRALFEVLDELSTEK